VLGDRALRHRLVAVGGDQHQPGRERRRRRRADAAREFEAAGGSVVVVDPNSGEILALASWPFYNPNDYGDAEPADRKERSATVTYEPGSSVKI